MSICAKNKHSAQAHIPFLMLLFGFDTFFTHDRSVDPKRNAGRGDRIRQADPQFEFGAEEKCHQLREERHLSVRFLRDVVWGVPVGCCLLIGVPPACRPPCSGNTPQT